MIKLCKICGSEMHKKPTDSIKYWDRKKYCSMKCYGESKKGMEWTEESRVKISNAIKGHKNYYIEKGESHHRWRGGCVELQCKTCGKLFNVKQYRKDSAKYCSRKCKTDDNLGLTVINERDRKSKRYKMWRDDVYKRDNYTCQSCGKKGGDLHADHIKPFAYYPEERFNIDNGRTLCVKCHKETDSYGTKAWRKVV